MSGSRPRHHRQSGWSLIELTIILIVLSILCAILSPVISIYIHKAKIIRCREDLGALSCTIWMFIEDSGNGHFYRDGSPNPELGASRILGGGSAPLEAFINRVNLIVGDGDVPSLGINGDIRWVQRVNFEQVDFMEYHLCTNRPGNNVDRSYRTPTDLGKGATDFPGDPMFARDESGGFNSEFAWRGPYMTAPIDPDPWGNRYMCNVQFLDARALSPNANSESQGLLGAGYEYDVVMLSAGPDEEVDTRWAVDGLTPGDDDLLITVSANSDI